MHYWIIDNALTYSNLTAEQVKRLDEHDERLIGYLSDYGDQPEPEPSHGIRRPAWFNPRGATVSDVNRIGLQMRGKA